MDPACRHTTFHAAPLLVALVALAAAGWGRPSAACAQPSDTSTYEPTEASLKQHTAPQWFKDAKLGIFIHWGLYSVPAWATTSAGELGEASPEEWFANNSYAEWYLNTLRIEGSPTAQHHRETYGEDFDYYDFAAAFNEKLRQWDPEHMAQLFDEVGARYVVLTSKHHDGFTLWPSRIENPHLPEDQQHPQRDVVGELAEAVRSDSMRFGLYYSGGIDWSFHPHVIKRMSDLSDSTPPSQEYAQYADAQWRELIDRYEPAVLWNDITYPEKGHAKQIMADYYNAYPEGVVNNRWGEPFSDFTTPEYAQYDVIVPKKWEATRGIGKSFGYNQNTTAADMLSVDELVDSFVDIVSKNGNLLLNVGPKANGTIPEMQVERLRGLGRWLKSNGEALFGTRPWLLPEARALGGTEVRFTRKGASVYATLLETPSGSDVQIERLLLEDGTHVELLSEKKELAWEQRGKTAVIKLPETMPDAVAHVLKITPQPWYLKRQPSERRFVGTWQLSIGRQEGEMEITGTPGDMHGTITLNGQAAALQRVALVGSALQFAFEAPDLGKVQGEVELEGDNLKGTLAMNDREAFLAGKRRAGEKGASQ